MRSVEWAINLFLSRYARWDNRLSILATSQLGENLKWFLRGSLTLWWKIEPCIFGRAWCDLSNEPVNFFFSRYARWDNRFRIFATYFHN